MDFKNLRIPLILMAALVTLAVLFGARFAYQRVRTDSPLSTAMSSIPGVRDYDLRKDSDGYVLSLSVGPVKSLRETVDAASGVARQYGKAPLAGIELKDKSDVKLREVYYQMHFVIEEAAVRGNFTEMKDRTDRLAARAGLRQHRIEVTDGQLYVQLQGDGAYLYRIVNRVPSGGSQAAMAPKGGIW